MNLIKYITKTIYDSMNIDLLYFNTYSQNEYSSVIKSAHHMIYNNGFISQEKKK